jgi:hypothetical protein
LWLQSLVAAKDLVVSPVAGTKNPADLGTKRLSPHRMLGLMFVMGMYDTALNERVGEEEAQAFLTHEHVKKAIKTINCCAKVPHQALQLMLLVNALGLGKGDDDFEATEEFSWMYGFLSLLTGFLCAMVGLFFFVRVMQRRQLHGNVYQQVAAEQEQQHDPAVANEMDMQSDELDESAEPILNTERATGNAPSSSDHAGDLARMLRLHGFPPAYERYSPEHMILWLIIRGQGRIARYAGTNRGRLWTLRVRTLIELLQHVRTCTEPTVRQRAMTTMLDAGDFSSDDQVSITDSKLSMMFSRREILLTMSSTIWSLQMLAQSMM